MKFFRELENFITISVEKTWLLIWNLKQQMLAMNNKMQPPEVFHKKTALKNFSIFTSKYLCWSLFLIKMLAYRSVTLLKRDSNTVANIAKFLKMSILKKKLLAVTSEKCRANYFIHLYEEGALTNVSQNLQKNTFVHRCSCRPAT